MLLSVGSLLGQHSVPILLVVLCLFPSQEKVSVPMVIRSFLSQDHVTVLSVLGQDNVSTLLVFGTSLGQQGLSL